jgi:hypothetical protein
MKVGTKKAEEIMHIFLSINSIKKNDFGACYDRRVSHLDERGAFCCRD